ncbi:MULTISPECIES: MFS transporter [Chromobacterium]|uniref:MFS transporter n=1 Tax=Chromobacterium TaxID=535 RepID=UPI0002FA46EA|nr:MULTISPECIES: MFS transporter [Chromobacterium]BBH13927.1 MFS transporter [Chromobacterium haemolyticum]
MGSISRPQLGALFCCMFIIGSAEVAAGPMMALMGRHFGVPSSAIAYLPAAYGLCYGVFALVAGPLSDRFGRKPPLQLGLLGFALCCALLPLAPNLNAAVALSALSGLCAAVIQPNALALVADLAPRPQLGQKLGQVFIGLMLAFVLTPALAGRLADTAGWQASYYALAAAGLLAWAAVRRLFRADGGRLTADGGFLATLAGAWRTPGARRRLCVSYLWLGWVAGFGAVVAEVAARKLTLSSTGGGLLAGGFGLVVVLGNLCGPPLQRRLGEAALPAAALAAALGILSFLLPLAALWQLALAGSLWAFGYGCAGPLHHARLSTLSERYRGTLNSYHASLLNLGIFSASLLLGLSSEPRPIAWFCAATGLLTLAGALLLLPFGPGLRPASANPS